MNLIKFLWVIISNITYTILTHSPYTICLNLLAPEMTKPFARVTWRFRNSVTVSIRGEYFEFLYKLCEFNKYNNSTINNYGAIKLYIYFSNF